MGPFSTGSNTLSLIWCRNNFHIKNQKYTERKNQCFDGPISFFNTFFLSYSLSNLSHPHTKCGLGIAGRIKGELPASIEFVPVGIIPPPMTVPYLVVHYLALGPPSSSPMPGLAQSIRTSSSSRTGPSCCCETRWRRSMAYCCLIGKSR